MRMKDDESALAEFDRCRPCVFVVHAANASRHKNGTSSDRDIGFIPHTNLRVLSLIWYGSVYS